MSFPVTMATNHRWYERLLLLFCFFSSCPESQQVTKPFREYGVVHIDQPFKFVGSTLELYCNITSTKVMENSSMLYLTRTTAHDESVIPREFIEILTTKAIRMRLRNLELEDEGNYICQQKTFAGKTRLIGHQIIKVDYEPQKVKSVDCRVYNWEKMTCTWDLGINYQHLDNVNVSVVWAIERHKDSQLVGIQQDCPHNLTKTSCTWDENIYIHGQAYLMVVVVETVYDKRVLSLNKSDQFRIETQLYVEPAPVKDLKAEVKSSSSILLSWQHSVVRDKYFVGEYRVKGHDKWINLYLNQAKKGGYQSLVTDLAPDTEYEFRLSVMPYPTDHLGQQGFRSQWRMVEVQTMEDVPEAAPKICPGCFHELHCSDGGYEACVRIYWQDLEVSEKNGKLVSYNLTYHNDHNEDNDRHSRVVPVPPGQNLTSADLQLSTSTSNYKVSLTPATSMGYAKESSSVLIPAKQIRPEPPRSFLVKRNEREISETKKFYLSWAAVTPGSWIKQNYTGITVVWCVGKRLELQCEGDIHWIDLPADQVTYELAPKLSNPSASHSDYMIGISAETTYKHVLYSSGIHWSHCVYLMNLKPENSPKNVRQSQQHPEHGLAIMWDKFECAEERSFVTEYLVKYCPSTDGQTCLGSEKSQKAGNDVTEVSLADLQDGIRYRVTVIAVSEAGLGPSSTIFTASVEGPPPEPDRTTDILIGVGIGIAVLLLAIVFMCWRYCSRRRKKADDLIQPYAQTPAFPSKKTQDIRNRPLPKTPEDQHIYGSSACMNNLGSETPVESSSGPHKNKDNRSSESSSEDSVNSHSRLLANPKDLGSGGARREHGSAKEMERLLDPQHSSSTKQDKLCGHKISQGDSANVRPDDYSVLGVTQDNNPCLSNRLTGTQSAPNSINMNSSGGNSNIGDYHVMGLNESSSRQNSLEDGVVDIPADINNMNTLPIRNFSAPITNVSLWPVLDTRTGHQPVLSGVDRTDSGCHDQLSNVHNSQPSAVPYKPSQSGGYAPNTSGGRIDRKKAGLSPIWILRDSQQDLMKTLSNQVDVPPSRRRSVPIESVLHFPPPPSSPPSPCPEDYPPYVNSSSCPESTESSQAVSHPASLPVASPSSPLSPYTEPPHSPFVPYSAVNTAAHFVLPTQLSDNPAISVDYLPHNSPIPNLGTPRTEYQPLANVNDIPSSTLPRAAGHTSSTLLLPTPLFRPLSGELLDLPEKYYQDPSLGGSNQILTEL